MKKGVLFIGLGIAFLAVSLWVVLSRGRSAKAVRAKFRLGGAMLTLVSLTSLASCERGAMVTCYDPVMPPYNSIDFTAQSGLEFRNGDKMLFHCICAFDGEAEFTLTSAEGEVLQSEKIAFTTADDGNKLEFTVNVGDYRGAAKLAVSYDHMEDTPVNYEVDIVIVE